jgi:hypothetical protein
MVCNRKYISWNSLLVCYRDSCYSFLGNLVVSTRRTLTSIILCCFRLSLAEFLEDRFADPSILLSAEYLPISDSNSWDNTGKAYNVTRILTPEFTLDLAKYKACHIISDCDIYLTFR